jgi:hypothetical protein
MVHAVPQDVGRVRHGDADQVQRRLGALKPYDLVGRALDPMRNVSVERLALS